MYQEVAAVNEADLKDLSERMKLIANADSTQSINSFGLKRALRAFKTPDQAFQVNIFQEFFKRAHLKIN